MGAHHEIELTKWIEGYKEPRREDVEALVRDSKAMRNENIKLRGALYMFVRAAEKVNSHHELVLRGKTALGESMSLTQEVAWTDIVLKNEGSPAGEVLENRSENIGKPKNQGAGNTP